MKLKEIRTPLKAKNLNRLSDAKFIELYVGQDYLNQPAFENIYKELKARNYRDVMSLLNNLSAHADYFESAIRFKAEILFFIQEYEASWEHFDQILKIIPHDKQALFLTLTLAEMLEGLESVEDRLVTLRAYDPILFNYFFNIIDFIETHNKLANFEMHHKNSTEFDVFIVFGQQLNDDGSLSEKLKKVLKKCLKLYLRNPEAKFILCGGAVHNKYFESIHMFNYLVSKGVPSSNLIINATSTHTIGNVIESIQIICNLQAQNIGIISSQDHLPRAYLSIMARSRHLGHHFTIDCFCFEKPYSIHIPKEEQYLSYYTTLRMLDLTSKSNFETLSSNYAIITDTTFLY
ncbi:YdcF family protein [Ignavigranum ruoffiae]|uniref:YdcF family protein n=1 Tax=Ignavigranum ruoffiae TaxID=89093 RepID=UPI00204BCDD2|nr:YdcF family protein [Ignavigranum ruoffiae]UPQ85037.1 YdcF family protein [Ignavigranum ruoffiae]